MAIRKADSSRQGLACYGSLLRPAALALAALTLAACGGGGGGGTASLGGSSGVGGEPQPAQYTPEGSPATITLAWDANSVQVSGYRIYSGPSKDTVTDQIYDLPADGSAFNSGAPSVGINAERDLGLPGTGTDNVCFAVQAYNVTGTSEISAPVCATI